jgi:hypothetical protein
MVSNQTPIDNCQNPPYAAIFIKHPLSRSDTMPKPRKAQVLLEESNETDAPNGLLPFVGYPRREKPKGLPSRLQDYLELVDWTGRAILENKRGYIPGNQPQMLERLQIDPQHWLHMI